MSYKCTRCNEMVDDGDDFCGECGTKLISISEPSDQPELLQSDEENDIQHRPHESLSRETLLQINCNYSSRWLNQNRDGDSDCEDFCVEWNTNSSVFITEHTSTLQFRITPLTKEARKSTNFRIYLRYPNSKEFIKEVLIFNQLMKPTVVNVNYRPSATNKGLNQSVELCFSYSIADKYFWFGQSILIDVYSSSTKKEALIENINIKFENIRADKASDINFKLFDGVQNAIQNTRENDLYKIVDKIKSTSSWQKLDLINSMPLEDDSSFQTIYIPPAPKAVCKCLTLITFSGTRVQLHGGNVKLGRDKACDIVMRNLPTPDEGVWSYEKMRTMNEKISGNHCTLNINDNMATITDNKSTNGTYFNNYRVINELLPLGDEVDLVLAQPDKELTNISLLARAFKCSSKLESLSQRIGLGYDYKEVYGGIRLKRKDAIDEVYLIINRWIPLCTAVKSCNSSWLVVRHNNNFAITNGIKWIWLKEGVELPYETAISTVKSHQQYLI